jgi:hypothetical protein
MIIQVLSTIQNFILNKCESFTNRKNWIILLSIFLPFLVLFLSFPSYERINTEFAEGWQAILRQASNPFINHEYDPGSHQSKLTFRLTMPIIANVFNLGITGILIVQALFGSLLFYFSAKIFERVTEDKISALLLTFSLAFIYAGKVSFTEIRGIFDGLALFFLVFSMYFKNPILIFLGIFLTSWTDERGLIASSIVFLFWMFSNSSSRSNIFNKQTLSILLAWAAYFVSRYLTSILFNFTTYTEGTGLGLLVQQINNMPLGVWSALEGNWILILASAYLLQRQKKYFFTILYICGISIILCVAMSVYDITRSMSYMLPAIFLSTMIISEVETKQTLRKIILFATVLSFIYPAYYTGGDYYVNWTYPFPLQLLRYFVAS